MAKVLSALFVLFMLAGVAFAGNLGTTAKTDSIAIEKGSTAQFSLLFWSTDDEAQEITLSAGNYPDGWDVVLEKERINISSSIGNEQIYLGGKYIKVTSVKVFVNPGNENYGKYGFAVNARSLSGGGDVGFAQERKFSLNLIIQKQEQKSPDVHDQSGGALGTVKPISPGSQLSPDYQTSTPDVQKNQETEKFSLQQQLDNVASTIRATGNAIAGALPVINYIYIFAVIVILLTSFMIYRYS